MSFKLKYTILLLLQLQRNVGHKIIYYSIMHDWLMIIQAEFLNYQKTSIKQRKDSVINKDDISRQIKILQNQISWGVNDEISLVTSICFILYWRLHILANKYQTQQWGDWEKVKQRLIYSNSVHPRIFCELQKWH